MIRFLLSAGLTILFGMPGWADGYWAGEGYVVPKDGVTLRVRSTLLVSKVLHDIGDQVKKGDVLMQFDDRNAKIDLQIAMLNVKKKELELKLALARMEVAKAHVSRSQADFERLQKLFGTNAISKEELTRAEADLSAAKAEVASAEIQVEIAKAEVDTAKAFVASEEAKIDELSLRAPFDGVIVARYTTIGDWISKPDQGLFDMVGKIYLIEAPVPSRLLSTLKDKTPIEIAVDSDGGDRTFKAQIALVSPVIDPRNKTIKVQFSIPEAEMKALRPGMLVTVKIGTKKGDE